MFAWTDLISDLQTVIRQDACDPVTRAMLRLTCKAENAQPRKDNMLKWLTRAAAKLDPWPARGIQEGETVRHVVLGTPLASFFRLSCSYGYLEVCKFVLELGQEEREILCLPQWYAYGNALQNGHFEVADWAFEQGLVLLTGMMSTSLVDNCVKAQNLNALKWLREHHFEMPVDINEDASDPDMIEWLLHTVGLKPLSSALNKAYLALPASRRTVLAYLNAGIEFRVDNFQNSVRYGSWNILDFWKEYDAVFYEKMLPLTAQRLHEMRPVLADNECIDSAYNIVPDAAILVLPKGPYSGLVDLIQMMAARRLDNNNYVIGTHLGNGEVRLHAEHH